MTHHQFRKFYFDTRVYTKDPLELLFKIAGTDRCLFGNREARER